MSVVPRAGKRPGRPTFLFITDPARAAEQAAKGMPPLPAIATLPGSARWQALIEHAEGLLETAATEMQDYYDDRTEAWQESERGAAFLERVEALQEAGSVVADLRNS